MTEVEELKTRLFDAEETIGKLNWYRTAYSDLLKTQKHVPTNDGRVLLADMRTALNACTGPLKLLSRNKSPEIMAVIAEVLDQVDYVRQRHDQLIANETKENNPSTTR